MIDTSNSDPRQQAYDHRKCAEIATEYLNRNCLWSQVGKVAVPLAGRYLLLNRILRARHADTPLVLCYHAVVPDDCADDPLNFGNVVSVSEFSDQLTLLSRQFKPITLKCLERWIRADYELPPNSVLITFDDGYRNNLTHAAPILNRFGIPAVCFVTVGYIGYERLLWPTEVYRQLLLWPFGAVPMPDDSTLKIPKNRLRERMAIAEWTREYCKLIPEESKNIYLDTLRQVPAPELSDAERQMFSFLSWQDVEQLQDMGFEIGSHTVEHCILTRVSSGKVATELQASKERIERELGRPCVCLAYPNGSSTDYSPQVLSSSAQAGYKLAFTTNARPCARSDSALALGRICIPGKLSRHQFQSRISSLHEVLKHSMSRW